MTTKVIITSEAPNHQDIMVETINAADGKAVYGGKRVTEGESAVFWVHQGQSLRVIEVQRVSEVKE